MLQTNLLATHNVGDRVIVSVFHYDGLAFI